MLVGSCGQSTPGDADRSDAAGGVVEKMDARKPTGTQDAKAPPTTPPETGAPDAGAMADSGGSPPKPDAAGPAVFGDTAAKPDAQPPVVIVPGAPCATPPPVKVIFDTDIGPDCDDAGAVAMLHALADRCEIEILGMTSATSSEWGAPALDAMNTYYGRPNIPVGTLKEAGFLAYSAYSQNVAQNFPNDLKSAKNAPDAVTLTKELLTAAPDGSVTMVSVGPLRNARNLIKSAGGRDLVAKKVKEWSVMGGFYPSNPEGEWNFKQDGGAAREAIENWPTPIMFSGAEVGGGINTGSRLFAESDDKNPVLRAYQLSPEVGDSGRPSWDLTSVLYAARGLGTYFTAASNGYNEVGGDGINNWRSSPNRKHSYLIAPGPQAGKKMLGWAMDDLVVHAPKDIYPKSAPLSRDGWKATANAGQSSAAKAVDNDLESEWGTGRTQQVGDWIAVDMGKSQPINRIELDNHWPGGDFARAYELYVSEDGTNWGEPVAKGKGSVITVIVFETRTARHFKIVQTGTLSAALKNTNRSWRLRGISAFLEP